MTGILAALGSGVSAKKILEFLMRKSPELAPKINKVLAAGLSADKVLSFFTKGQNFQKLKASMEKDYPMENNANPLVQAENVRSKNLAPDMASGLQRAAPGLALGAGAVGTAMALRHAIPNQLETPIEQKTLENKTATTQQPPNLQNIPQSIPQPQQIAQPEVKNIAKDSDILWNALQQGKSKGVDPSTDAFMKMAKKLQTTGEIGSKEDFDKLYDLFQAKQAQGMSVPKALKEATQEHSKAKLQPQAEAPIEEAKPIAKNETVATPHGVGEVIANRNGKAIVEVDGKKHQVNEADLDKEPEEIRQLDLEGPVSEYLARIPEGQKSSVIDVSLYDPTTNELQVRFPNGDQWVYGPIPEEVFEKINSMTGIPISSGESKLRGTIWETGVANSAGADFYKLIKKFVKEGQIKERKLKTGIDLFRGFTRVKKRK